MTPTDYHRTVLVDKWARQAYRPQFSVTRANALEYVEAASTPEPNTGCWLWPKNVVDAEREGGLGARARMSLDGRMVLVGRVVLGLLGRSDLQACHRCDNANCVNPRHLFAGSAKDNSDDMIAKGRARHPRRTHCHRGHELTPENSSSNGDGKRTCRICRNERHKRNHANR